MNKLIMATVLTAAAAAALTSAAASKHVPERLDNIRLVHPSAARHNHILVSDVGGAIPPDTWKLVATYAISRLQLNVWTNAVDAIDVAAYTADPSKCQKDFGDKAKICVFLLDDPKSPPFVSVPGRWCAANVHGLAADGPNAQTLRDRYAKTLLKGMAYACGSGATLEPVCSLFHGTSSLAGMDRTAIIITPMAYFPMLETLRALGGSEMLTPAMDE